MDLQKNAWNQKKCMKHVVPIFYQKNKKPQRTCSSGISSAHLSCCSMVDVSMVVCSHVFSTWTSRGPATVSSSCSPSAVQARPVDCQSCSHIPMRCTLWKNVGTDVGKAGNLGVGHDKKCEEGWWRWICYTCLNSMFYPSEDGGWMGDGM